MKEELRAGAEIDAYCTKCRLVTNHRIVAMAEGVVKRVICLTCDGQHNFRSPPGAKKTKSSRARRVMKGEKRVRNDPGQAFEHWVKLKSTLPGEARSYIMAEAYRNGEAISHATFGLGFVNKILNDKKMEVMFEKDIKTLAMNYKT
jgi:hypothetical protein